MHDRRPETDAHDDPQARAIHTHLCESTRSAVITQDFRLFRKCHHLPHIMLTADSATAFETERDLRRLFDGLLANLSALKVTRYERRCGPACFLDPQTIAASHQSFLYAGEDPAAPPALVENVIELIGGLWVVTQSRHEVDATPILKHAFASGRPLTPVEAASIRLPL